MDQVCVNSGTHTTSTGSVSCDLLKKQGRAIKNKIIRGKKEGMVSERHGWLPLDDQFLSFICIFPCHIHRVKMNVNYSSSKHDTFKKALIKSCFSFPSLIVTIQLC